MTSIDLNADLGEEVTDDAALLAVVTSANVACGYHAGTPAIMRAVSSQSTSRKSSSSSGEIEYECSSSGNLPARTSSV